MTVPERRTHGRDSRGRVGPSIADVAKLAGVSGQTVSRVANGSENVSVPTRERVLEAMDLLDYAPNTAARALRNGSFKTIGIVAHHLSRSGESMTIDAVVESARTYGYTVSLIDVETPSSQDVTAAAHRLSNQAIDGLVIIRAENATPASLQLPPRLPVVVSDSRFLGHHPAVTIDHAVGARSAVQHLLDLGHRTVTHIAGPAESALATVRRVTWEETLAAAGRQIPEPIQGDWTPQAGYAAGLRIDPARTTAVFSGNDEMAAGLLRGLYERGLRVPQDISVVGFDDLPWVSYLWPPLTTVRQNFPEIGTGLMRLLIAQITDQPLEIGSHLAVPTTLILRESTAAPSA